MTSAFEQQSRLEPEWHLSRLSPTQDEGVIYCPSPTRNLHSPSPFYCPSIAGTSSTEAYNTAYACTPRTDVSTPTPTTFWSKEYSPDTLKTIKEEDMDLVMGDLDMADEEHNQTRPEATETSVNLKDRLITQLSNLNLSSETFKLQKEHPVAAGGFADIWLAVMERKQVAIKTVRSALSFDAAAQERAVKELHVWSKLQHSHVLQLLGFLVDSKLSRGIALISKFHPNGSASTYIIGKEPIVVLKVILGACLGLSYLHSKHVIHGDFRGDNLLISRDGEAIVADFGLSKVLTSAYNNSTDDGNPHWTAPEIFLPEAEAHHTKMSDVWSCGMTILELFSGKVPYHGLSNAAVVIAHSKSELPKCPVDDRFGLLDVCSLCWNWVPYRRSSMDSVVKCIQSIVKSAGVFHTTTVQTRIQESVSFDQREFHNSNRLELRVWEARRRVLGAEHPDTLVSMNNLALTYHRLGRLQEAQDLQQRVLEARRRVLGTEHPDTLTSIHNLGSTYQQLGRLHEAEELVKRALEARRRILGTEHQDTLSSMNNLALTYERLGRVQEAEDLRYQYMPF